MKLKLTALATAVIISSSVAHADNTTTATVGLVAYVAAGLSVGADTSLVFGDIVQPDSTTTPHTMSVACSDGTLTYGQDTATPDGDVVPGGGANAEKAFANGGAQAGSVIINGEPGYGVTITAAPSASNPALQGVIFTPSVSAPGVTEALGTDGINAVIDDTSLNVTVNLCGTLSVAWDAAPSTNISLTTDIMVSYR